MVQPMVYAEGYAKLVIFYLCLLAITSMGLFRQARSISAPIVLIAASNEHGTAADASIM